jgi:hypothetical protein
MQQAILCTRPLLSSLLSRLHQASSYTGPVLSLSWCFHHYRGFINTETCPATQAVCGLYRFWGHTTNCVVLLFVFCCSPTTQLEQCSPAQLALLLSSWDHPAPFSRHLRTIVRLLAPHTVGTPPSATVACNAAAAAAVTLQVPPAAPGPVLPAPSDPLSHQSSQPSTPSQLNNTVASADCTSVHLLAPAHQNDTRPSSPHNDAVWSSQPSSASSQAAFSPHAAAFLPAWVTHPSRVMNYGWMASAASFGPSGAPAARNPLEHVDLDTLAALVSELSRLRAIDDQLLDVLAAQVPVHMCCRCCARALWRCQGSSVICCAAM